MENEKTKIISITSIVVLALTLVSATFAYFMSQTGEGKSTDIKINASTVDTFSFETGSEISLNINQENFASGTGNQTGTTYAKAMLTANNKTNTATENYNLFLNISDNSFGYTQSTSYPEILLTIKDSSNNEITSISGLEYKTVTDGKGTSISGFDVTTKTGLITLLNNREITTTSTKTDTWNIAATFVNYNVDQSKNAGKGFSAQILISKDSFDNYTPNTINTLSATKSGSNLTVNLSVENGSNAIDKYYYAIEEKSSIAYNTNTFSIKRLANTSTQALSYVESTSSSYTFTNIDSSKNYVISAYAMDKNKIKTNTYEYNYYSGSYVYPVINKVETTLTTDSITVKVTATKGTNNISKYYYSIDGGSTFVESTSNSYTLENLNNHSTYKIFVKIADDNNKYSNAFIKIVSIDFNTFAFYLDDVEFQTEEDMTWEEWLDSSYSDGWNYKGTFLTFLESDYIANIGNAYYPIACEKKINDNLLLVTPRNGVKYNALALYTESSSASLSYGNYKGCAQYGNAYNCDCYSSHPFVIKRTNKIKQQLQNVDEGYFEFLLGEPWKAYTEDNKYYTYKWGVMCLSPETLIDVEEIDEKGNKRRRRKKLKDIKVGDKVICINPFTLELDTDTVVECDGQMNKKHTCYDNWYFNDGTIITTIYRHRFYNVENNKFMYMEEWNIGEHGLNINNEKIELIKHEHIEEEINHCTLFTEKYNNYFANGLLSGNRNSKSIKL